MNRRRFGSIAVAVPAACLCGGLALRMASASPRVVISTTIVSGPTRPEEVPVNTCNDALVPAVKLKTKGLTDLYAVYNTIAPGGHTGAYSHPGPSIMSVKSGVATEYHGDDPGAPQVHAVGTSFIHDGERLHFIRNEGTTNLSRLAVEPLHFQIVLWLIFGRWSPPKCAFSS